MIYVVSRVAVLITSEVTSHDTNVITNFRSVQSFLCRSFDKIQANFVTVLWHWGRRQSFESSGRKIKFRGMHLTRRSVTTSWLSYKSDLIFVPSSRRRIVSLVVTMTTAVKAEKRAKIFSPWPYSAAYSRIFSAEISRTPCSSRNVA